MSLSRLDVPAHPVGGNATPLEARDELPGHVVEVLEHVRERLPGRLLHREHLDVPVIDVQMAAVALHRRIRDEVIEVRVVGQCRAGDLVRRVVDQPSEEDKRFRLGQSGRMDAVGQLHLEGVCLVMQPGDGELELVLEHRDGGSPMKPLAEGALWIAQGVGEARAGRGSAEPIGKDRHIEVKFVEVRAPFVEVRDAPADGFFSDRVRARARRKRLDPSLQEVLIHPVPFIELTEGRLEAVHDVASMSMVAALVVDATDPIQHADLPGLGDEHAVIHESPNRQHAIQRAGLRVVAEDPSHLHHHCTSMTNGACFAGS